MAQRPENLNCSTPEAGTSARRAEGGVLRLGFGQFFGRIIAGADAHGVSVRELADRPPAGVPRHTHEHAHFCLVVSGEYETCANNLRGRCPELSLLFHPAGTTHDDRFVDSGGRCVVISLEHQMLEALAHLALPAHSIALHDAEIGFPGSRIRRELRRPDGFSAMAVEGMILELVGQVARRDVRPCRTCPSWLAHALSFLRNQATAPVRVGAVAEAAGVHPVHLARVFREHLGLSPGEYLRRTRVQAAMRLIEQTTTPLAMIAAQAGFCDQSELTRSFRRELGVTPGDYRRMLGN